jgi:hypothetical protein
MSSDYVKLTNVEGKTVRVAYDSIEIIVPQSNTLGVPGLDSLCEGSTIYTSSGARLWVREQPEYIDHMVEAMGDEHIINYEADDENEY